LNHNGATFVDAMFDINNVKYYMFTLMAFGLHHIRVLIIWVIKS
jgi:hypothetical protein